eukprot:CAMPEP_0115090742 /NCGR_PEP_ID=MMETSP0227-20121206/25635_1 /TAXON_ID=89957 /ORGANISM="Polarella glacialis, Strain CCMP 1383" /LENGTH=704 /DNA_ID=CAMNT_0002481995 /DNA_START=117 /DNA_END=2231 /DNA_ORIENTATION=-
MAQALVYRQTLAVFCAAIWTAALFGRCEGQAGVACTALQASSGSSYRWALNNPALAAPVLVNYQYATYLNPLMSELTDRALVVHIPPDFRSNFKLSDPASPETAQRYLLQSIELRKPAVIPEGSQQALSHVLEAVLVHRENTGTGYWASVVVPFEISTDPSIDMLTVLLDQATLPTKLGETQPLLVSTNVGLNLSEFFENVSFQHFWATLPTGCPGTDVHSRILMRNSTILTSQRAVKQILAALTFAPGLPPVLPPQDTWQVNSCPRGSTCSAAKAQDLSSKLTEAQSLESSALATLEKAKSAMDASLLELNSSNVTNAVYDQALGNKATLVDAETAMSGSKKLVVQIQTEMSQATSKVWDADAPPSTPTGNTTTTTPAPTVTPKVSAKPAALIAARSHGCSSAARRSASEVDLSRDAEHVDATQAGAGEALLFWRLPATPGLEPTEAAAAEHEAEAPRLSAANLGDALRVSGLPEGKPLLVLLVHGRELPVSFADVSVPGVHAISSQRAAAEIQLVHLPSDPSEPAVAVALQLDEVSDDDAGGNAWLEPLLGALPAAGELPTELSGADPLSLHAALGRGVAGHYFRYDGRQRDASCSGAQWKVLEERGQISSRQLQQLRQVLRPPGSAGDLLGPSALQAVVLPPKGQSPRIAFLATGRSAALESANVAASTEEKPGLRSLLLALPRQRRAKASPQASLDATPL